MKDLVTARPRLLGLAWRNTLRNTRRTILTGSAVVVAATAVIFMMAYIKGIVANVEDAFAINQSGHARITAAGFQERERFMPLYLNIPNAGDVVAAVREYPAVAAALPRIRSAVLANTDTMNTGALALGIDLAAEHDYLAPQDMLDQGRMPAPGRSEALVGAGLAEKLGLAPGDSLTILGQTAWRSFGGLRVLVAGTARSGMAYLDQSLVILPLDQAQLMAEMPDAVTEILVLARQKAQRDTLAALLRSGVDLPPDVEVTSWRAEGGLLGLIQFAGVVWNFFLVILMAMAGLIIVNTMLMAVLERTQELGMLAAMGMRRRSMMRLILSEGLIIGLAGSLIGAAIGTALALWVEHVGIDFSAAMEGTSFPMSPIIYVDWHWTQVLVATILGVATGVLASIYPARRAIKLAPAEALRR
jgi:putative ABC transport system permease protein